MKILESAYRNTWLFVLFCSAIRLIWSFPLNLRFIASSDFSIHFFRVWYISAFGVTNWNYLWYGGYPFLYYYPPLAYLLAEFFSMLTNPLIAFKLSSNIAFLLTPFLFFIFLRELNIPKNVSFPTLFLFSIFPVYPYYLIKGSFATMISLPFLLTGMIFFLKYTKKTQKKYFLASVFTFSFGFLTHAFSFVIFVSMCFVFLLLKEKFQLCKFIYVIFFSSLIPLPWFLPMMLGIKYSSSGFSFSIPSFIPLENFLLKESYIYAFFFVSFIIFIWLVKEIVKIKDSRPFLFTTFIFSLFTLFFSYKRPLFFLPIFASIALAYGNIINKKIVKVLVFSSIVLIFFVSLLLHINYFSDFEDAFISHLKEGRSICLPVGTCAGGNALYMGELVLAMHDKEVITGWFPQSQSKTKLSYIKKLSNPLGENRNNYYELLRAGYVNNIIVNKKYKKLVEYFSSSDFFEKFYENKKFVIFSPKNKSSYIELNGKSINATVEKGIDEIKIKTFCKEKGIILVKESYHPGWKVYLNGNLVTPKESKYGFIEIPVEKGECEIRMHFEKFWFL